MTQKLKRRKLSYPLRRLQEAGIPPVVGRPLLTAGVILLAVIVILIVKGIL